MVRKKFIIIIVVVDLLNISTYFIKMGEDVPNFWNPSTMQAFLESNATALLFDSVVNVQLTTCLLECFGLLDCVFDEF